MTILSVFRKLVVQSIARDRMRRSFAPLLDPTDDHLLEDLGVSRADLAALIRDPMIPSRPLDAHVRLTLAATTGAGFSRWATSEPSRPK